MKLQGFFGHGVLKAEHGRVERLTREIRDNHLYVTRKIRPLGLASRRNAIDRISENRVVQARQVEPYLVRVSGFERGANERGERLLIFKPKPL